ncbi:MAG: hypothetical protein QF718_03935 [Phycisphaerales bacterium]|nr:hypothetical protein [Phycisphaerales bacterium]
MALEIQKINLAIAIGLTGTVTTLITIAEVNSPDRVCYSIGPDVVSTFWDSHNYGSQDGASAFAFGTDACNIGDEVLNWEGDNENHPVIATAIYKLDNNRFEQVGMSWVKHGFAAAQSPGRCDCECIHPGDYQHLGIGCADAYGATTNGYQGYLGPRSDVNGFTGEFPFPPEGWGETGDTLFKRLQVHHGDLESQGTGNAQYFGEIQYVSAHDSLYGNQFNNSTWQPISFNGSGVNWSIIISGLDRVGEPVINAWNEVNPSVRITESSVPSDGAIITGALVTAMQNGWYQYEYAIQNVNAQRGVREVEIELPLGGIVFEMGFNDITYHSDEGVDDTDWLKTQSYNSLHWSTDEFEINPLGNALRWGTTYNFRFISNIPPADGNITLRPYQSGYGDIENVATKSPNLLVDPCSFVQSPCPTDVTNDGTVDVSDLLLLFDWWGDCGDGTYRPPADSTGDCCVDVNDLLDVIDSWGESCSFGGACCLPDESCLSVSSQENCEKLNGNWIGPFTLCKNVSCNYRGACCLPDGSCEPNMQSQECVLLGGIWMGIGSTCLDITCTIGADDCANAITIQDGLHSVDTTSATTDGPNHEKCDTGGDNGQTGNDIWFKYFPKYDGMLTVSTCEQVGGSADYDTDLVIYEGTDCSNLVLLDCDDDNQEFECGDAEGGWHSNLVVPVSLDSSYLIRLGGWQEGSVGTAELLIELE